MIEYSTESGNIVNLENLVSEDMRRGDYIIAHKNLPILCHDAFIFYGEGILLITRDNFPAIDILWPIGERIKRGIPTEESLKIKVREECGLELESLQEMGIARTFFETDPFVHCKGTDTIHLVYSARGFGELKLDKLHKNSKIVTRNEYNEEFRQSLHPYVKDFIGKSFSMIE